MLTTCKSSQLGMNGFGLSGIFSSCSAYLFTRDTPSGLGIVFYQKAMIRTGYCLWVPFYFFLIFFYYYLHVLFTSCCFWVCYRVVWLNAWERYSVCLDSTEATLCFKATFSYIFFFTRFGVMRLLFMYCSLTVTANVDFPQWTVYTCTVHGPINYTFQQLFH